MAAERNELTVISGECLWNDISISMRDGE